RIAFMLADARVPVLLTLESLRERLPEHDARVLRLDADAAEIDAEDPSDLEGGATGDNLAYVIYTSGSTGRPKGAAIVHSGLANYLHWALQAYPVAAGRGAPVHSSVAFDLTVTGLFPPLLAGRAVHLLPEDGGPEALGTLLRAERDLSLVKLTPAHLELLSHQVPPDDAGGRTRAFVVGGENLSAETLAFWQDFAPDTLLVNEYGPTETVVGCCVHTVPRGRRTEGVVPIGRPIWNTQLYVLDRRLQPVPVGVPGELYIGGAGLARGYLHRPDLTAERFVPHPFSTAPGARLYRTGDLARYLPGGELVCLGRVDDQVKVRGYRIELGEVEAVLLHSPEVREAVATVREDRPGEKRLVAYVVPRPGENPTVESLRRSMQARVPDYMVPAAFVLLPSLPLTRNGKVDRAALPEPASDRPEMESGFVPPRTPTEEALAAIWSRVLGVDRVGVEDNFFALGGDSIVSIQIVAKAKQAGLRLTPRQVFQYQTIAALAPVVDTAPRIRVEEGPVSGPVPLTPVQHWFFEQELPDPHHYNQAMMLEVRDPLDPVLLDRAARRLVEFHDALRLRCVRTPEGWEQTNAAAEEHLVAVRVELGGVAEERRPDLMAEAAAAAQTSLSLEHGPLLRVVHFDLGDDRPGRLLLVVHHLAVDGVSWRILLEDLQTACEQLARGEEVDLGDRSTSFKHWAERLVGHARSLALRKASAYWLALPWDGAAPLPVDFPGGPNSIASAEDVSFSLTPAETQVLLHDMPTVYRTQINDVLLTALAHTYRRLTGSGRLVVNLEGHGREELFEDVELSRTVGWFTSIYPVLVDLGDAPTAAESLPWVKEQLRAIPDRGVSYGLLRYLSDDPEVAEPLRRHPEPELSFNYLGQFDQALSSSGPFGPAPEPAGPTQSPHGPRKHLLDVAGV
ncbi:MAG TPA: amino acid adenylation domain-containing protein, partial [Longimicrobiaceae bacterium]